MELVLSGAWLCIREAPPLPPGLPHNTTGPPKQNLLQLRILAATPTVEVAQVPPRSAPLVVPTSRRREGG